MTATSPHTTVTPRGGIKPGEHAPELAVDLVGSGRWQLAEQHPEHFTMIVFYRGLHCPVCRAQLSELNRRLGELDSRGVTVIAISGDTRERAERSTREWHLNRLTIGYGLGEETARAFGLFLSRGITEDEPARFSEPGLFLVRPDGTVYYEALTTMSWVRPRLDDILGGIDYTRAHHYPARGEA